MVVEKKEGEEKARERDNVLRKPWSSRTNKQEEVQAASLCWTNNCPTVIAIMQASMHNVFHFVTVSSHLLLVLKILHVSFQNQ